MKFSSIPKMKTLLKASLVLVSGMVLGLIGNRAYRWWQYHQREFQNYPPPVTVTLTSTNLPIVLINTNNSRIYKDKKIDAVLTIIQNEEGKLNYADTIKHKDQTIDYAGTISLKYRGNSSFTNSEKKPFSIKLDSAACLLGMRASNKWALQAPYSDRSLIRDVLTFELAKNYFEYSPEARLCEVILDGKYYGVYFLSEKVTGMKIKKAGEEGNKLTGGYIIEMENPNAREKVACQSKNWNIRYCYKKPDEKITDVQRHYIDSVLMVMETAFLVNNYEHLKEVVDIQSFLDYQLISEFTHNHDSYSRSVYLYKHRDKKDGRIKATIWDYNVALGNGNFMDAWRTDTWRINDNPDRTLLHGEIDSLKFFWGRLLSHEEYRLQLKERWKEYRANDFSDESVMHKIDSLATLLTVGGAEERNGRAWQIWRRKEYGIKEPLYIWPNKYVSSTFEDEIEFLKDWIRKRLIWIDNHIQDV